MCNGAPRQLRYMKISGREQVYKITKSRDTEKPTLDIKNGQQRSKTVCAYAYLNYPQRDLEL